MGSLSEMGFWYDMSLWANDCIFTKNDDLYQDVQQSKHVVIHQMNTCEWTQIIQITMKLMVLYRISTW